MKWVIATLLPILFNAARDEKHKLGEVARFFEMSNSLQPPRHKVKTWIPVCTGMTHTPCYSSAETKAGRMDKSKTRALFCARLPALVRIYADIFRGIFFDSRHPCLSGQARPKVRLNPLSCGFMLRFFDGKEMKIKLFNSKHPCPSETRPVDMFRGQCATHQYRIFSVIIAR